MKRKKYITFEKAYNAMQRPIIAVMLLNGQVEQVYQNSEGLSFDISIDSSVKIDRSNKDFTYQDGKRTLYQTFIKLKSATDVVIFMRDYHPAEIDFDKGVQLKLVKRGKALEELKRQADTFTTEQTQQICSGYDEIVSLLSISAFDGFGFTELYQVMSDNNCDIKTALAECAKAVTEQTQRAEEEARKAAEKQRKLNEISNLLGCGNILESKISGNDYTVFSD